MTRLKKTIPLFQKLTIESQSNCNLSCWFCSRTYDQTGTYLDESGNPILAQMPTGKIVDLLDQAQQMGFVGKVAFHHFSEPLLDRRNVSLATEARNRGMRPTIHTNGTVLKQDDRLFAAVKEVYEYVVIGLYDYATNEELEAAKEYWTERLEGIDLRFSTIGISNSRTARSMGTPRALAPSDSRFIIPDLTYTNAPCRQPLMRMLIRYDGVMANCCEDVRGDFELGNVYESSLEELWYSERHTMIVESLLKGHRDKHKLCSICPLTPAGPAPDGSMVRFQPRRNTSSFE